MSPIQNGGPTMAKKPTFAAAKPAHAAAAKPAPKAIANTYVLIRETFIAVFTCFVRAS